MTVKLASDIPFRESGSMTNRFDTLFAIDFDPPQPHNLITHNFTKRLGPIVKVKDFVVAWSGMCWSIGGLKQLKFVPSSGEATSKPKDPKAKIEALCKQVTICYYPYIPLNRIDKSQPCDYYDSNNTRHASLRCALGGLLFCGVCS